MDLGSPMASGWRCWFIVANAGILRIVGSGRLQLAFLAARRVGSSATISKNMQATRMINLTGYQFVELLYLYHSSISQTFQVSVDDVLDTPRKTIQDPEV